MPWQFIIFGWFLLIVTSWQLFEAIRTRQFRMRWGRVVRRDESPGEFWLMVVAHLPLLAVRAWLALFSWIDVCELGLGTVDIRGIPSDSRM